VIGLLIAVVVFVCFVLGFLFGSFVVMAIRINLEDRAATKRMLANKRLEGAILLHEEPEGFVGSAVRKLLVGQRTPVRQFPEEQWRPPHERQPR